MLNQFPKDPVLEKSIASINQALSLATSRKEYHPPYGSTKDDLDVMDMLLVDRGHPLAFQGTQEWRFHQLAMEGFQF